MKQMNSELNKERKAGRRKEKRRVHTENKPIVFIDRASSQPFNALPLETGLVVAGPDQSHRC